MKNKDFTVEKAAKPDQGQLDLAKQAVVLRGGQPETVQQFEGREATMRAELALIGLKQTFGGTVFRAPAADEQTSFSSLTVAFEKESDARIFRGAVRRLKETELTPGAFH